MQAIMVYVTDCYERYAASASAAVCLGENLMAGWLPLAAQALYGRLVSPNAFSPGFRGRMLISSILGKGVSMGELVAGFCCVGYELCAIDYCVQGEGDQEEKPVY